MKLLRPTHYGVVGIFFPIGIPAKKGTCEFANEECLRECWTLDKDYDEIINILEEEKREVHNLFVNEPIIWICNEIIKEMNELQAKILSWFVSGDCLSENVDRFFTIILLLDNTGIIQNGFTRNKELHTKLLNNNINNIVLTVESKSSENNYYMGYPECLYGIPNYEIKKVELYYAKLGYISYGSCGGGNYKHDFKGEKVEISANCLGCYNKKIGCFINIKSQKNK